MGSADHFAVDSSGADGAAGSLEPVVEHRASACRQRAARQKSITRFGAGWVTTPCADMDSVSRSEPTVGIQTSSWSPPRAPDLKRRKRCRTKSSQSEESWARIVSMIAIMKPALRSHVEEKLTAVDHLPKASRVTESTDSAQRRPVHLHPGYPCPPSRSTQEIAVRHERRVKRRACFSIKGQ